MKYRIIIFICLICLLLVGFGTQTRSVAASSNTYYVAKTGNDSNGGSQAHPFLTISKAVSTVVAGDTVYVETGTYNERVHIGSISGDANRWTTFSTFNNESVIIDGTGFYCPVSISNSSYIIFNGFQIQNSVNRFGIGVGDGGQAHYINLTNLVIHDCYASGISCDSGSYNPGYITNILISGCNVYNCCTGGTQEAISMVTVDNFEITNCLVHDAPVVEGNQQAGIDAKYGCTNGKIHNNEVYDVGCGIYVGNINQGVTSNIDVYNNLIHGCNNIGSTGILLDSENSPISMNNINMYNNILYGNYRGIEVFWEVGVGSTTKTFSIINNTFYHNGGAGLTEIYLADTTGYVNCVVENNLIVGSNDNTLMICNKATSGVMIDHNLFYDAAGYYTAGYDKVTYGANYIQGNPLLVSPDTGNFNIAAGSPAIGAGLSTLAPAFDFIGTSRPQGMGYDIGAYEYETVPGSAP